MNTKPHQLCHDRDRDSEGGTRLSSGAVTSAVRPPAPERRAPSDAPYLCDGREGSPLPAARSPVQTCRARSVAPPFLAMFLCALGLAAGFAGRVGAQPVITNVTAAQQPLPSKLVNITYTISDPTRTNASISIQVSKDSGATWTVPASSLTGDAGANVSVSPTPTNKAMVWNAGADWDGHFTAHCRVRVVADDTGLATVPAGTFSMGDANDGNASGDAPVHSVTINSPLKVDPTLVTGGKWNLVVDGYALLNGYDISEAQQGAGSGPAFKAANHPVQQVTWYDAVKWCNARSQMEGLTPCYYTDPGFNNIYMSGAVDAVYVNTATNGYRLPTEAEWEMAARGGANSQRFPFGNTNSWSKANYFVNGVLNAQVSNPGTGNCAYNSALPYDNPPGGLFPGPAPSPYGSPCLGTYDTSDPSYSSGPMPYTSPTGALPQNGYGLFDMAGNVEEWCWDWYGQTSYMGAQTDPQGEVSGTDRVARGGSWSQDASHCRCANRDHDVPSTANSSLGFRCVRAQ
jgi:formylglycine-generating enzyme required for sulfatase activity